MVLEPHYTAVSKCKKYGLIINSGRSRVQNVSSVCADCVRASYVPVYRYTCSPPLPLPVTSFTTEIHCHKNK